MAFELQSKYKLATDEVFQRLITLLDITVQTAGEFLSAMRDENNEALQLHFNDLEAGLATAQATTEKIADKLPESQYADMFENIVFTLNAIVEKLNNGDDARVLSLVEFQLMPFLQELLEDIYFWGCVYPKPESLQSYYSDEFAEHHHNTYVSEGKTRYTISLFVPAYNKLDYTKKCVQSILDYTDLKKLDCELILINHGSSDGTQEYFESIPGAKVVQFKKNVRMVMFNTAFRVAEGKYYAFVSNDTIVTKNWLDNLYTCISSSDKFILATPTTPNMSNLQSIDEPYSSIEEMHRFAAKFNQSTPRKWHRRARILPVIALYNSTLVNGIGFADRYFKTMEFWDDDFSIRAKRKGYVQILCRDTYCYHFGSVTGREAQKKENTLVTGRDLFIIKHGVDAWLNDFCYDGLLCHNFEQEFQTKEKTALLMAIDPGLGDTVFQIGNILREQNTGLACHTICTESRYLPDITPFADVAENSGRNLAAFLDSYHAPATYNYIYIGSPIEHYYDWKNLLSWCLNNIAKNGVILFSMGNPFFYPSISQYLGFSFGGMEQMPAYIDIDAIRKYIFNKARDIHITAELQEINKIDEFIDFHYGGTLPGATKNNIKQHLQTKRYCCTLLA